MQKHTAAKFGAWCEIFARIAWREKVEFGSGLLSTRHTVPCAKVTGDLWWSMPDKKQLLPDKTHGQRRQNGRSLRWLFCCSDEVVEVPRYCSSVREPRKTKCFGDKEVSNVCTVQEMRVIGWNTYRKNNQITNEWRAQEWKRGFETPPGGTEVRFDNCQVLLSENKTFGRLCGEDLSMRRQVWIKLIKLQNWGQGLCGTGEDKR